MSSQPNDEFLNSLNQVYACSLEASNVNGHVHLSVQQHYINVQTGLLERAKLSQRVKELEEEVKRLSQPQAEPLKEETAEAP